MSTDRMSNNLVPTAPTPVDAFLSLIERASRDPEICLDKLQQLLDLRAQEYSRVAALRYREAMSACQAELEPVRADCNNPQTKSKYAALSTLDAAARPVYSRHGFSLSFDTADCEKTDHVRVVCRVYHSGGHDEMHHIDMPADGKGAKGGDVMTRTHATGSAVSYGRRYLLGMVFNICVERDDDGIAAGGRPQRAAPPSRQRPVAPMPPHDPVTGEVIENPAQKPESSTGEFWRLRESLRQVQTWAALCEWYDANKDRVRNLPEDQKTEINKFFCIKRTALQPKAEAAE
jgi:hypothetical protein